MLVRGLRGLLGFFTELLGLLLGVLLVLGVRIDLLLGLRLVLAQLGVFVGFGGGVLDQIEPGIVRGLLQRSVTSLHDLNVLLGFIELLLLAVDVLLLLVELVLHTADLVVELLHGSLGLGAGETV